MMEVFTYYLLKSVIWLSGFALVYLLFLRNERFFLINRIYLLAGIIAAIFLPFFSIHYTVVVPVIETSGSGDISVSRVPDSGIPESFNLWIPLFILYVTGAFYVSYKVIKQSRTVLNIIKNAEVSALHSVKLIRTSEYSSSFSFFSYVFVNPSVTDIETKEIVNHELAHIRQKHWFDLVLIEFLCLLQWFNPVVWIYIRFIRQNHEYLADEVALQRTSDPAIYRAALLNQIVGAPVIVLANSFNYSVNKKRFKMMKSKISSPYRKLKVLLVLPVIAVVLYSFAKPEYKYIYNDESKPVISPTQEKKEVKGTVINPEGKPLAGTTILIRGTNDGVITDNSGFFNLDSVPENGILIVSYVGFKTRLLKPVFTADMSIKMQKDTVNLRSIGVPPPPPPPPHASGSKKVKATAPTEPSPVAKSDKAGDVAPPPPPPPPPATIGTENKLSFRNTSGSEVKPLFVIDGVIVEDFESGDIDPNSISTISVYKDQKAIDLYGAKGKDGVIEITTKANDLSLVIVDGVVTDKRIKDFKTVQMERINWIRSDEAIPKYGEKGKNGVILITTRDNETKVIREISDVRITGYEEGLKTDKNEHVVIEEMPAFPGGERAIKSFIYSNIKVVKGAEKTSEPVNVVFTVDSNGKVREAQVLKKKYPVWEAEAIRVISSMPDWKPGMQNGKPIDVILQLPVDFSTFKN